ncbi:transposase, partial [Facklamia sp. DSM 111018]
ERYDAETFLRFLQLVLERYPTGKIVMILDNARIHHAKLIQPFLKEHEDRLELVFLPPYSPQLNLIGNRTVPGTVRLENVCAILCVLRDRTEQKQMEAALQESEKWFRIIAEHSSDYILILSNEGKVTYISPSFENTFGIVREECLKNDLFRYVHPEDVLLLQEKLQMLYGTNEQQ